MFKLIICKEGNKTKILALVSLDLDKRVKSNEGLKLMHKNWIIKGYDQSVTCLADDRKTLVIRSSKPRTPETLPWTNNSIHKHSIIRCKGKTKRKDLNWKFKWIASICKKNQSNRSYETQTTIKRSSNSNLLESKF